jgi:hypothetical protein
VARSEDRFLIGILGPMPITLVAPFALVAIAGAVFEERARRSGAGWRSVARDFLAAIGAIALLLLSFAAIGIFIAARGGST